MTEENDVQADDVQADGETQAPSAHQRLTAVGPYLTVAAVSLLLTRSFWTPGHYVVGFDTYAYSGPNLEITERALRAWQFPLLNDAIFGGVPHLGNPQAAVMYPAHLLTLAFETNRAMGILVALHVIILGTGMVLLARRLGLGRIGATAAGAFAVASGSVLTKTTQFEQILVLAWAPLLLAAIHAVLTSKRPWPWVAALSATTAAVLLAGHPQLVYETMMLAVAATIGFAIGDQRWRRLPHLAAGITLGASIALPQLVAAASATSASAITGGRDINELLSPALSLDPSATARAIFGTIQDRDPAVFAGGFESIGFVGVVVAVLALVGLVQALWYRPWRPWAISLSVMALLALVWAAGPRSFLFRVAYDVLPGFDLARASARWLVVLVIVMALFAGIGTEVVVRGSQRHHVAAAILGFTTAVAAIALGPFDTADQRSALIWLVFAVAAVGLVMLTSANRWQNASRVGAMAIIVLAIVELSMMSMHSIPQSLRTDTAFTSYRTSTTEWLSSQGAGSTIALTDDGRLPEYQVPGFRPNTNVLAGVRSIDGYDGGVQVTERWADALERFTPTPATELPLRNSLDIPIDPEPLARLGVRFILIDQDRAPGVFIPRWVGPRASDDNFEVWENPSWIGDAIAWPAAAVVEADEIPALLRDSPGDYGNTALLEEPNAELVCEPLESPCSAVGLVVDRPSPEHLVVRTNLEQPTIVMVAQQALPGWQVEIDGDNADELVVDGLFLGVEVPAGDHVITWRYKSPWLWPTIVISLIALAATAALALGGIFAPRGKLPQAVGGGRR